MRSKYDSVTKVVSALFLRKTCFIGIHSQSYREQKINNAFSNLELEKVNLHVNLHVTVHTTFLQVTCNTVFAHEIILRVPISLLHT